MSRLIMAQMFGGLDKSLARVGKRIVHSDVQGELITVEASSTIRAAPCPSCHSWSNRLHGSYVRHLQERPILEQRLVLAVQMNRFKCSNADCPRRTLRNASARWPVAISAVRARKLGLCWLWATLSEVSPRPGLPRPWACVPVLTPYCASCEGPPGASGDRVPESSASMTGRSRGVTATGQSLSTWSGVNRSKCSKAEKRLR